VLIPIRTPERHLQPLPECRRAEDDLAHFSDQLRCGVGWLPTIAAAARPIREARPGVTLVAGRKHGVLQLSIRNPPRFDESVPWERISNPIAAAIDASSHVCEFCGRAGELRTQAYFYTACDGCESKQPVGGWVPR
jgi:hypothetical protein